MSDEELDSLQLFDKTEWWDICRVCCPHVTREEFEEMWQGFEMGLAERLKTRTIH
jgi:hypothetical protein